MNIPEGWPTDEMTQAGFAALPEGFNKIGYDVLRSVFKAMIEAAPTPPAQEDGPVAYVRQMVNTQIIDSTGCKVSWEDLPDETPLYTRPDGLRNAAEEALHWLEYMNISSVHNHTQVERARHAENNLRAALEGK